MTCETLTWWGLVLRSVESVEEGTVLEGVEVVADGGAEVEDMLGTNCI